MNAWFAGGVLAGILAVAIYGVLKKRKESAPRYDERQAQARANAAKLALEVLAALMLVNGFVREAWQFAWAGPFMETVVLLLIAGTVYVLRCVWTDAYFALREKPKTWGRIFVAMLVVNAALGVMVILDGDMVEDGLLTFPAANLLIAVMFASLLITMALKRRKVRGTRGRRRRNEEPAPQGRPRRARPFPAGIWPSAWAFPGRPSTPSKRATTTPPSTSA